MYSGTYLDAGEELWFKTKEELFVRYPCLLTIDGNYKKIYDQIITRRTKLY